MQLPFRTETYQSEKNGTVTVRHLPGETKVIVGDYEESGRYLQTLWHKALLRVPESHPVKQVLMLGGAGTCAVREVHKRFKDAHVLVVDWDPVMVEIAKSLKAWPRKHVPEFVVGDAKEAVKKLNRTFDLILVDLFTGGETDPNLASDEMVADVAKLLEPEGYLLLNLFRTVGLIPAFEKKLSRQQAWQHQYNTVACFRHYGQGRVGDPVPEGFVHQMQSQNYLLGGWPPDAKNAELVGKPGCYGMRWHYGPMWMEAYTTDVQPEVDYSAPTRMLIWQPITKLGKPAGWHRSWIQMNPQQHGFADIKDKPEYWKEWTDHAQRHRKKWLKDERYEIVEASLSDFVAAYHKTGKLPMMRKDFVRLLERRIVRHGSDVHLFAARDKETREIISGLAVCDLPDTSHSMHVIAYINPKFEKTSVGTGIIDHWYKHCQATGIRFPHFGLVWTPGDPNSWKGYSKFKRQFNLFLLRYPYPLIRFPKQRKTAQ
ncbi:methyltransferase domain-containing protein [bacterium]|nr:methyltransferase domain-containing protein [bacterium]